MKFRQAVLLFSALVGSSHAFTGLQPRASVGLASPQLQQSNNKLWRLLESPEDAEMESSENKEEHEMASLDLSKTIYTSSLKAPKDSYIAFAEKGAANCHMPKRKIFHQAVLGGCYVGFGALLSFSVAGTWIYIYIVCVCVIFFYLDNYVFWVLGYVCAILIFNFSNTYFFLFLSFR